MATITVNGIKPWGLILAGGLAVEVLFFWRSWVSGFSVIYGDLGDPRIALALLEHWWLWLSIGQPWGSPTFFYSEPGLLGYTDAYFLFAIPYVILRFVGADTYLAMELSFHVVKAIGYLGMVWLLRKAFFVTLPWAVFGGLLFSLLNGMVWHAIHMQLAAVAVVPWLLGFVCLITSRRAGPALWVAATVLLAALFLTSFYIAWFFVLCTTVFFILVCVCCGFPRSLLGQWRVMMVSCFILFLAMTPFFILYYPVWVEKQGHPFSTVLQQSLFAIEVIRVGPDNFIWGWLEDILFAPLGLVTSVNDSNYIANYERISGFTPGVFFVFLLGFFSLLAVRIIPSARALYSTVTRSLPYGAVSESKQAQCLALASALTFVFYWLVSSRWGDFSAWQWVYQYVPGGTAMRVPSRLMLFLGVFVVPVAVYYLSAWHKRNQALPAAVAFFLLFEQLNFGPVHNLSRQSELAFIRQTPRPPLGCEAFYVASSRPIQTGHSLLDGFYIPNVDAMILASHWRLPTLNGMSTWAPAGWALERPESASYNSAVVDWVRLQGLDPSTLCALNMQTNEWYFPAYSPGAVPSLSFDKRQLRAKAQSPDLGMLKKGWSVPEDWGVWSAARHLLLSFNVDEPTQKLVLDLQAYGAENDPVRVTVALTQSGESFELLLESSSLKAYELRFTQPLQGEVTLDMVVQNPRRPIDYGASDTRWLGIGLIGLRLQ